MTEDARAGTVRNFRGNSDTYFLTADECIMAGHFQNIYRNPCRYSSEKHFGSKFVTVVVTGDSENQIHFQGYQVSNQCASLVRDEVIIPTYDAPELAFIRETNDDKFIPDVYYRVIQKRTLKIFIVDDVLLMLITIIILRKRTRIIMR